MENNNTNDPKKINKPISNEDHYHKVLKEIKLYTHRSALLKYHRDTDNLDFDGR